MMRLYRRERNVINLNRNKAQRNKDSLWEWGLFSTELTHPVAWDFVSLEHLFSKFLVATIFDCVNLESVRVGIYVMVLCEHITHWEEGTNNKPNHADDHCCVWNLASC
jgi:hypothetical protein